jgi:release factor glutamine methyltransferase
MSVTVQTIQQNLARASELESVSDSARLDVELLLAECFQRDRTYLYTWPEKQLSDDQQTQFENLLARRLNGEPVAHILGEREFWSLPLEVNPSTLIPRPDTERLVEVVLDLSLGKQSRVLDLGTGTGAIALALASEFPEWKITAVDQSVDAVELASRNRDKLGFSQVEVLQSNWFSAITGQQFDVIVSNPPYIDETDIHLQQGDVRFEPLSALVAPDQGLADIRHIAEQATRHLAASGWLVVEHGYQQAEAVQDIFRQHGFSQVKTEQDYGGNDRVTLGQLV